jgi:anti-sigma regulatory factor (Ser/Thr protein kinase)/putative methionine-R-sulfoxide reductase with GAF domain
MTPDQVNEETTGEPLTQEQAVARLEDVQRLTDAALAYLDPDDLLSELLNRVKEILRVDTAAVLLVEDDGRTLAARAAKGLEEEVERGFRLPIGRGFAGTVAATKQPVVIPDLDDAPVQPLNPLFREKRVRSLLGVPLVIEGKVIGVLHVGSLTPRDFGGGDVDLLQIVADRVALSIERARLVVQDRIAQSLQRSLLPRRLPQVPGLRMAARYLPAAQDSAVGGDWYDVIELGHRRLALTIGDVAGHGMAAATFMSQLRNATRAYARDSEGPGEVLSKLSRFSELEHTRMATMIYAAINLDTWVVNFARAGHPYPLLLRADGTSTYLTEADGPPLGVGSAVTYGDQRLVLGPGETLMLYTDGLIERRGERLTEGEDALAEAIRSATGDPELMCQDVIAKLTNPKETADDVAVLVLKAVAFEEKLRVEVPANAEQLAPIRHLIRRWIASHGGTDDDCAAFAIAVTEACANAVEHAYGPEDATIEIDATLEGDVATVSVGDRGAWREPRGENRGRGIPVMREFMDDVRIDRGDEGTTVSLRRQIGSERR